MVDNAVAAAVVAAVVVAAVVEDQSNVWMTQPAREQQCSEGRSAARRGDVGVGVGGSWMMAPAVVIQR